MSYATIIILFLSHFQQAYSNFIIPEKEMIYDENSSDFSQCSNYFESMKQSYLTTILLQIEHPGSILMLTDCVSGLGSGDDIQLFSYVSFAFISPIMLYEISSELFGEGKLFVIVDLPETGSGNVSSLISELYEKFHKQRGKWEPTILLISRLSWATNKVDILNQMTREIVLAHDSNIFAIFLNMGSKLYPNEIGVWEMYGIKTRRIFSEFALISLSTIGDTVGSWNEKVVFLEGFARRRRDFQEEALTASVKYDPTFKDWVGMEKNNDGSFHITRGFVALLYWDLQKLMNFSESVILGDSPYVFPNGSLGGITVAQLELGEADLTLNQISFSPHRAKVLTFLHPTYYSLVHAFFKQPSQNSIQDIVVAAFHEHLWIVLILACGILVMSIKLQLLLLDKKHWRANNRNHVEFSKDLKFARESVLWSVAVLCQKTWYLDPYSTSLRIKFLIGSFVGVMSYTAYSAAICSSLAVNRVPVKTFIDLISFNFIFTVHEHSEPYQTMLRGMIKSFNLSQDVVKISTIKEISHLYSRSSTIASDIRSTKRVFLSPADMFYKTALLLNYTDSFICDHITSMHAGSYLTKSAMLVKKDAQFKEVLNYMLIYLIGRGLISRNIERYNTKNFLKCTPMDQQGNKVAPAEFTDTFTVVLVLFVGIPTALLLLIMEVVHWTIKRNSNNCIHKEKHRLDNLHEFHYNDEITSCSYIY